MRMPRWEVFHFLLAAALLAASGSGCSGGATLATTDAVADASETQDAAVSDASEMQDAAVPDVAEKRCGMPGVYFSANSPDGIARLAGCTVLVGRFQQDSVGLVDFSGLESVRKIEGVLNVFRCNALQTLKGFDNLEVVEGNLFIHLNEKLESLAALGKLRTITGNLIIMGNPKLPQAEIDAFTAHVTVGGAMSMP